MIDLISRADALTVLSWYTQTDPLGHTPCQLIEALPSAQPERCEDCVNFSKTRLLIPQPERKKGKWIDEPVYKQTMDGKTLDGYTYCSECREMHEYWYRSNYCPSCGAEMAEK